MPDQSATSGADFRISDLQFCTATAENTDSPSFTMKHKMGLAEIDLMTDTYYKIVETTPASSPYTTPKRTTDTNENVTASSSFNTSYSVPFLKNTGVYYAVVKASTATTFNSNTGTDQWKNAYVATIAAGNYEKFEAYSTRVGTSTYSGSFSYTGTYQTFTVPFDGTYTIQCWGAQGGVSNNFSNAGEGAYVKGNIELRKDEVYYVYVGGQGSLSNYTGGWNGGGTCGGEANDGGGGGSTDIRLKMHTVTSGINSGWAGEESLASRIIVAAGGGGSDDNEGVWSDDQGRIYAGGGGLWAKSFSNGYGVITGATQTTVGSGYDPRSSYSQTIRYGT